MFVLREVFDVPYDEIAEAVGKSPAAVRQIAHRAREHVAARRPRMQVEPRPSSRQVVERFLAALSRPATCRACSTCSRPTSSLVADGGGAGRRPRVDPIQRCRAVAQAARRGSPSSRRPTPRAADAGSTARPALRIDIAGELDTALSFVVEDGRITRIYAIRNPDKLTRLDESETHVGAG